MRLPIQLVAPDPFLAKRGRPWQGGCWQCFGHNGPTGTTSTIVARMDYAGSKQQRQKREASARVMTGRVAQLGKETGLAMILMAGPVERALSD